ncbi:MAG TPA: uroporphyrinogen-III C-methyltransferase, partial [Chloroflexota bacterium]|nr:uroporphyrinogen-III C-methyltransferase [Chloroflexota bacterium]
MSGSVALVGAGPGHPGLLTLRGRECLEQATVVVHDRLIPMAVLGFAPANARRIYVGKGPREHAVPQEGINDLLTELARAGERVVRLKGGDPFVFGRGGEEALSLRAHGIPFEVVPGISSAIAAPAFAGIPVTHRGIAASFTVLTGHEDPTKPESSHRWAELARGADTLIVLMGVEQMPQIVKRLLQFGRPPDQPAAIIQWGTTPRQRTVTGTLDTVVENARDQSIRPPAILVAGEVAALREELSWFDNLPLFGLRVLVTRSRQQASTLLLNLRELGAEPIELPVIDIQPTECSDALDAALNRIEDFDWVVFTSANGVRATMARILENGKDARVLANAQICAIGPATEQALMAYGLRADLKPAAFISTEIVRALEAHDVSNARVALFRSDIAPMDIVTGLQELGASVESFVAYRTIPAEHGAKDLRKLLDNENLDALTFTSSSTVTNF